MPSRGFLISSIRSADLKVIAAADCDALHTVVGWAGGMPMKQFFGQAFQRTTQKQNDGGESNGDSQHDPMTQAADEAEHRANPNRRGCR